MDLKNSSGFSDATCEPGISFRRADVPRWVVVLCGQNGYVTNVPIGMPNRGSRRNLDLQASSSIRIALLVRPQSSPVPRSIS